RRGPCDVLSFPTRRSSDLPGFDWTNANELREQVFSIKNITAIGLQFITVYLVAILGAVLLQKALKPLLIVFPIVYFLTIFALVLDRKSTRLNSSHVKISYA